MKYNLQDIIKRYDEGERLEYVFFWGHHAKPGQVTKACFSQWYPCVFEEDGVIYNCAEQYMMAGKARVFKDSDRQAGICLFAYSTAYASSISSRPLVIACILPVS